MQNQRTAARTERTVAAITLSVSEIEQVATRMLARNQAAIDALDRCIDLVGASVVRLHGLIARLDQFAVDHVRGAR